MTSSSSIIWFDCGSLKYEVLRSSNEYEYLVTCYLRLGEIPTISSKNILHDVGHIRNVENVRKDRMLLAIKVISKKWSSRNAHAPVCRLCERCFPNRRIVIGGHESIRRLASINVKRSRQELITPLHSLMIVISSFDRQF